MKTVTSKSGKTVVKMSEKEWNSIGKKAGWVTAAQNDDYVIGELSKLFEKEAEFRSHDQDILEMEERTSEDGPYGAGMSSREYVESLESPYIEIGYDGQGGFNVIFHGNYEPSSVNAGMPRRIRLGVVSKEAAIRINDLGKTNGWEIVIGTNAKKALGFVQASDKSGIKKESQNDIAFPSEKPQTRLKLTELRYQRLLRTEELYKEVAASIAELRRYLELPKFYEDTTVQVKDILARLPSAPTDI